MTHISQPTEFPPGSKADHIERLVIATRAILAWERLWPLLWPATGIAGLGLAAALFDVLPPLPWPLHALILACFVTAIALSLYFNLEHFVWPRWEEGARRLERDSGLEHRPISEADDEIALGAGDPEASASNVAAWPSSTVTPAGCLVTAGRERTVRVTALVAASPAVFLNTARSISPLSVVFAPAIVS